MKRGVWIGAAALVVFLLVLVAEFPAAWAAGFMPRAVSCQQLSGSIWNGTCSGLVAQGTPFGDVSWTLRPARLLAGRLNLDVDWMQATNFARGNLEFGFGGALTARDFHATFPLDRQMVPQLPPGIHGSAQADLAALHFDGKRVTAVQGQLDVHGLAESDGTALGDYRLSFPGGGSDEPAGHLSDLGGPLSVDGTLRLTRDPGFMLDAHVAARPSAPPDLAQQIQYLGSPDAQGRRPFSISATF
jgi:general secretion pathway protein N